MFLYKSKTRKTAKTAKPVHVVVDKPKRSRKPNINNNTNFGLKPTKRVKLVYSQIVTLTATSGVLEKYQFKGNGLHDPNSSGGGHQPYGHDQWKTLYGKYRVHGCSARIYAYNDGTQTSLARVGVELSKSAILPFTDASNFIEKSRNTRWAVLLENSRERASLSASAKTKTMWQVKDISDEPLLNSVVGDDPADNWFISLWIQPLDYSSTRTAVFDVVLTYDVEYYQPAMVDAS